MRIGLNPTRKQSTDYCPARVTICVIVYIPERIGYFAHRFEVLKLCLKSIVKHTNDPYDLLVFDNGSCPEVVDYLRSLRDQGIIQYLIFSACNIGKLNAFKIMFRAAPGEIIAYSDDDVLFHPGWLQAQLDILDTFPQVGVVSGVAVRQQFRYGNQYLPAYLSDFPEVSVRHGHFIPDEWERDFLVSVGRSEIDKRLEAIRLAHTDIVLECKGMKAYSTATHFQFVTPRDVILQALNTKWHKRLMGGEGPPGELGFDVGEEGLDERIDSLGYARLSTFERYVQHIGNVITSDFERSVAALGLAGEAKIWAPPKPLFTKLAHQKFIGRILGIMCDISRRLYNYLHFLLAYRPLQ